MKQIKQTDPDYPQRLKEIHTPPTVLYCLGQSKLLDTLALAVVGARKPTRYGIEVAQTITADLAEAGLTIVSGLAYGIDSIAHQAALDAGGKTVAVLGSGLNKFYPSNRKPLATQILKTGSTIITEFHPDVPPLKQNFPIRNRIISGLSLGVLIVEASVKSGSLITARSALEQNRDVFAIPGAITSPMSAGPNNLLKLGATPVTSAKDVLSVLNLKAKETISATKAIIPDSAEEALILGLLAQESAHIDELVRQSKLPSHVVTSTLTLMEMKGRIRHLGNMHYRAET